MKDVSLCMVVNFEYGEITDDEIEAVMGDEEDFANFFDDFLNQL